MKFRCCRSNQEIGHFFAGRIIKPQVPQVRERSPGNQTHVRREPMWSSPCQEDLSFKTGVKRLRLYRHRTEEYEKDAISQSWFHFASLGGCRTNRWRSK